MDPAEELTFFAGLLRGGFAAQAVEPDRQNEILLRGIVAVLEEWIDEGEKEAAEAAQLLREASQLKPGSLPDSVRAQAYHSLVRLGVDGRPPALDALFRLAIEDDLPAARQVIVARNLQPGCPLLRTLFDWFTAVENTKPFPESALPLLSESYFNEASSALRRRLLNTAPTVGMQNWARTISAVETGDTRLLEDIVDRYPAFTDAERTLALDLLDERARNGENWARETLFALYLRREEERARQKIDAVGYLPDDSEQRALYLFLSGEFERYAALDFDHRLLASAFENADRPLRRRLLEHSRHTGRTEWLRESDAGAGAPADSASPIRWLSDLTDADWQMAVNRLSEAENNTALWQLAQVAPPVWSAPMLTQLAERGWQPKRAEEREAFALLGHLARESTGSPLALRPRNAFHPTGEITCLAIHPGGQRIAAGSTDNRIFLWELSPDSLSDGISRTPISAPAPTTRTLAFDPSGEHLAAASGDHRIRVFRLTGGQMLKTLDGHRAMIRALAISPDSRTLYSAGFDGTACAWRFPAGPMLRQIEHGKSTAGDGGEVFSMVLGSSGTHLITGGGDGMVRAWALPDFAAARQMGGMPQGHNGTVTHLAASPTSDLVASAGRDGTLKLWNFTSGGLLRSFGNTGAPVTALCMHANDQILISGHADGAITLWSLSTGQALERMKGHAHPVSGLALAPGGDRLYSAPAGDAPVYAWDLSTILAIRLPFDPHKPGMAAAVQEQAKASGGSAAERRWMAFAAELARWRQRFDIELAEFEPIRLGEFDIEL